MSFLGGSLGVVAVVFWFAASFLVPRLAIRRLVRALGSANESKSAAAYMLLVKAGPRARRHLLEAADEGRQTAGVLQILADQGDPEVLPELERYTDAGDARVAEAAFTAVEVLRRATEEKPPS